METKCHLGKVIRYDTVSQLGWSVDVRTHSILQIIERLLADDWVEEGQEGRTVPEAKADVDCIVSVVFIFVIPLALTEGPGLLQLGVWGFYSLELIPGTC
jgi:putative lipase involved disintegration of autophagic bodies